MTDREKAVVSKAVEVITTGMLGTLALFFASLWWFLGLGYACIAAGLVLAYSTWKYGRIVRDELKQLRKGP